MKKKKYNLNNLMPLLLLVAVVINYLPLAYLNFNTKISVAVPIKEMVVAMATAGILLIIFYITRLKFNKEFLINIGLLFVFTGVQLVVQYQRYKTGNYEIYDFANILCKFINILLFYVLALNIKIDEKYLKVFMHLLIIGGIVACVQNWQLYSTDILAQLNLVEAEKVAFAAKSFFAQKNMFAFYLYTAIIAIVFLFQDKNKWYTYTYLGLVLILFMFNLVFTFSRTGTAMVLLFLCLWFLFTNKFKIIPKIIIIAVLGTGCYFGFNYINNKNPELIEKIIRSSSIKTFTGRTIFWEIAEEELGKNKQDLYFGIGRFEGEKLIEKYHVSQFHNTYVEFLISGGIFELVCLLSIYFVVFIKVMRSKMDKGYKAIYSSMLITFLIYMCFESMGRFSIGCSDTLGIIMFITIPLIHANCTRRFSWEKTLECESNFENEIKVENTSRQRIVRRNLKNPGKRVKSDKIEENNKENIEQTNLDNISDIIENEKKEKDKYDY